MPGYMGHRSRAAWNVALWIANDEGLYREALALVKRYRNRNVAARHLLAALPPTTPDGYRYTLRSVREALRDL